jgi:VWFA-related protein
LRSCNSAQAPRVIRASANLVLVDVVVTDHGKPVTGLHASRFHVFENGREQRIVSLDEHGPATAPTETRTPPPLPPNTWSNAPQFVIEGSANVLLLDALNTPVTDQSYVRQQMVQYARRLPAGTRVAVFTLASRLRMIEGLTTDAGVVERAVRPGKSSQSALLETPQDQDALSDAAAGMSGIDNGELQQFVDDVESFRIDQRVSITLDALAQLGRYLSAIPGRKNLLWFSGSFPLQIDPDATRSPTLTANGPASPLDPFSPMRDYAQQVRQTDSLLAAARVAVYPIDARGLMNLASVDASRALGNSSALPSPTASGFSRSTAGRLGGSAGGSSQSPAQKADARFLQQTVNEHQTMQQIAEETGGRAYYDDNGIKDDVAAAIANGSSYSTIGYIPPATTPDGMFRSIQVHVDGGKYELAYRRGYYAVDLTKPGPETPGIVTPIVAALQRGAPPLSQLIFEARVLAATDPAAKMAKIAAGPAGEMAATLKPPVHRYLVDFALDPHAVAWTALPNAGAHAEIEVSIVAWDAHSRRINYTDRAYTANLDLAQSQKALSSGLPIHQEIDLPSGAIYLRIVLHDLRNGRIGSMEIPLRVPNT